MAPLTAGEVIEAARFRHPQFTRAVIPTSVAANMVNEVVYNLLLATHQSNPGYLVRTWAIALRPSDNRADVGAGGATGAPLIEGTTSLERAAGALGALAELADAAALLQSESAVTGASSATLTDATRSWTVDLYVGARVRITAGLGVGQVREIASNTADTVTVSDPWEVVPDDTSLYVIEQDDFEVDGHLGVAQGVLPSLVTESGWLVRYDAQGQAYLDLTAPVEVEITDGIPLPPNYHVNHGLVFLTTGNGITEQGVFTLIDPSSASAPPRAYCGYVQGEKLFLCGDNWRWTRAVRLEIPYLPLNIPVTRAGDVLVLPPAAREAIVSAVASLMLERARQLGVAGAAGGSIDTRASDAAGLYLKHVAKVGRSTVNRIREVW